MGEQLDMFGRVALDEGACDPGSASKNTSIGGLIMPAEFVVHGPMAVDRRAGGCDLPPRWVLDGGPPPGRVEAALVLQGDLMNIGAGPNVATGDAIYDKFAEFHALNPHVYQRLLELALRVRRAGKSRYSINGLFEVLRYAETLKTTSDDEFRLNNNHRALYARMLMSNCDELKGFFLTRERTG